MKPEESIGSPATEVIGHELPTVGAGNQTQLL